MEDFPSFQGLISGDIFTVSQINERIKTSIEDEFGLEFVWMVGEISNFKGNYSSGHWYFSLKDENTQISAVSFKWANQYIKFNPENGMEVICCGQVSVYEKQGSYQINIRYIEPKGIGAQALALEQLKEKLFAEGLFDEARKRELPFLPKAIGIVTSPTGAVIKDILKTLDRRFPGLHIIISPARVQGKEAAADIAHALNLLYKEKDLDEIIIARGGGSKEDLMVFNQEAVVRTIEKSPVPVISAVGHEIDTTLADYVADLRAATPSAAAELVSSDSSELLNKVLVFKQRLKKAMRDKCNNLRNQSNYLQHRLAQVHPEQQLQLQQQKADELSLRLQQAMKRNLQQASGKPQQLQQRLAHLSPDKKIKVQQQALKQSEQRLLHVMHNNIQQKSEKFVHLIEQLQLVSPLATIARGYSVIRNNNNNQVISKVAQTSINDEISVQLSDGCIQAKVIGNR